MIFNPYLDWLGLRTRRPVAGLHITGTHFTFVALRRRPVRLVAVGRRSIPAAAVVDGDIRLVEPLVDSLRALIERIRIAPGTPTVAVVEPLSDSVVTGVDGSIGAACPVSARAHDRIGEVVVGAGLVLRSVDVVPAALARLGRRVAAPAAVLDAAARWSVVDSGDGLEARRSARPPARCDLRLGITPALAGSVPELPGVAVPARLRPLVDPGRDAVAVGGALAAFRHGPWIVANPTAVPTGSGWTVQPIDNAKEER